jgi:hypothetical protein
MTPRRDKSGSDLWSEWTDAPSAYVLRPPSLPGRRLNVKRGPRPLGRGSESQPVTIGVPTPTFSFQPSGRTPALAGNNKHNKQHNPSHDRKLRAPRFYLIENPEESAVFLSLLGVSTVCRGVRRPVTTGTDREKDAARGEARSTPRLLHAAANKKSRRDCPAALESASPQWRGGYRRREPDLLF